MRSTGAMAAMGSINLQELVFMMREGKMLDDNLTMATLSSIFTAVNTSFEEAGDDTDEQELDFNEFLQVIARTCHFKIPERERSGTPFEETLQSWLQLIFVPIYRGLVKLKKDGVGKKNV